MIANGAVRPWGRVVAFIVCVFVPALAPSLSVAKTTGAPKAASAGDPFEDSTIPGKSPVPAKADPAPASSPPAPAKTVAPVANAPVSAQGSGTPAPKESTPPPHVPSKEFGAFMKGFEGAWRCDTRFAVGALWPGSQALSSRTEVTIRKEFDGFMWHGEFRMARTATAPATTGVFQIGYATPSKQVTYLSYDSVGSSMMGVGTISGAQVTFLEEGFVKGAKMNVRETLAKQGPRKIVHKVELDQGKGLQLMAEDTCVK
jgi:hypothetical protein